MTLEEFRSRFIDLKSKGFIPTLREGNTGVGYTFEKLLELDENNLQLPDIGEYELKAHRSHSSSMITLFTKDNKWKVKQLDAIMKYGTPDPNANRYNLYFTLTKTPNRTGLYLGTFDDGFRLMHKDDGEIAFWNKTILLGAFKKKLPALIIVSADAKGIDNKEHFHYVDAGLYWEPTPELLIENIKECVLKVDLRMHEGKKNGKSFARNHGTAFRAFEKDLGSFFSKHKELD